MSNSDPPAPESEQALSEASERLQDAFDRAREGAEQGGKSKSTLRTYEEEFERFRKWCKENSADALPAKPETVATYLEYVRHEKDLTYPTLKKKASAINHAHKLKGHDSPTGSTAVKRYLAYRRKTEDDRPKDKSDPLLRPQLAKVLQAIDEHSEDRPETARRDRAMLMLGWICGLRRSEIAAIRYSDLERRDPDGYVLNIRRQKNDPTGKGMIKGVPRRPIVEDNDMSPASALDKWLLTLDDQGFLSDENFIFRGVTRWGYIKDGLTGRGLAYALQKRFNQAGLDTDDYTAHSLRSGVATEGSQQGASVSDILRVTGHTDVRGLQPYLRSGKVFENSVFDAVCE